MTPLAVSPPRWAAAAARLLAQADQKSGDGHPLVSIARAKRKGSPGPPRSICAAAK